MISSEDIFVKKVPTVFVTLPNGTEIPMRELNRQLFNLTEEEGYSYDFSKENNVDMGVYQYLLEEIKNSSLNVECTICEFEDVFRIYLDDSLCNLLAKLCSDLEDEEETTLNLHETLSR